MRGRFVCQRWLVVFVAWLVIPPLASGGAIDDKPRATNTVKNLRVTILSTMLADGKGIGEWGFAALVEADGHRLLFDTGARPGTVLANVRELGVDLATVTDVVLSHHHGDHTGGLLTLRQELRPTNAQAVSHVFVGPGIFRSRPSPDGTETNETLLLKEPFEKMGGSFVEVEKPREIFPGAWLTGPVPRRHPERNWSGQKKIRTESGLVEDTLPEDISLVVATEKGLVVITGCGHAGVINILDHARESIKDAPVHALIGGLHLFPASDETLDWTARELREKGVVNLLGAHCTGIEAVYGLRRRLDLDRKRCIVGAVGSSFDLADGIHPGIIAH